MKALLRSTAVYRAYAAGARDGTAAQTAIVIFGDGDHLRDLLKECAKAFFSAADGSRAARLIDGESYADCRIYPRAGEKLTVETAEALIDESLLRPVEGAKKLLVLDGFQTASQLVQNKLLKVLEEPPEGVSFLLGATAEHTVLPTVLSRARRFSEPPFSEKAVLEALRREHSREEDLEEAAAACGGVYSVAERLLSDGGEEYRLAEELLLAESAELASRSVGERKEKRTFLAALGLVLRDAMFLSCGREADCARTSAALEKISRKYHTGTLIAAVSMLASCEREIQFNANAGQAILTFVLRMREEETKWQTLS